LKPLQIEISGEDRTLRLDPDGMMAAVFGGGLDLGAPIKDSASLLSGQPGYRYQDCEIDMVLDREELLRFIHRDLSPPEYMAVRTHYGIFYMIHDDFYDERTGKASQPLYLDEPPEQEIDEKTVPGSLRQGRLISQLCRWLGL
jgi:hypothetical protein